MQNAKWRFKHVDYIHDEVIFTDLIIYRLPMHNDLAILLRYALGKQVMISRTSTLENRH